MIHASPFFESILTGDWAETRVITSPTDCQPDSSHSLLVGNHQNTFQTSNLFDQSSSINPHWHHHQEPSNLEPLQTSSLSDYQTPTRPSSPTFDRGTRGVSPNPHHYLHPTRSQKVDYSGSHDNRAVEPRSTTDDMTTPSTSDSFSSPLHSHTIQESTTSQDETEQDSSTSSTGEPSTILRPTHSIVNHPSPPNHSLLHKLEPPEPSDSTSPFIQRPVVGTSLGYPITKKPNSKRSRIEARINLKEERPASFQDLLMFVYPQLECVCTWHNASDLMTMSQKFDMPLLKRHVLSFLLSSVAGKPIEAMRIAEDHQLPELYRESSRFLLDNWQGWDVKELENLSSQTLLKLEKRRTWFLERLLKLGLVNTSRDYVCPSSCPDPQHCSRLVDDKWKSAWGASFKFGPPQPSSVYRALRCLEPSLHSPALLLPHTSCQQHALRFFADLFDRMFSQFTPRGGGGAVAMTGNGLNANGLISAGGTNSSNNHTLNPVTSNQNNLASLGGVTDQHSASNHQITSSSGNLGPTSGPTAGSSNAANNGLGGGFAMMNSGMSNILNSSDKTIRKAKYFLHVELFENHHEKLRKRFD